MMKLRIRAHGGAIGALLCFLVASQASAQTTPEPSFDKTEIMVPMRDGVKLHTLIFTPRNAMADLPILMSRTPYGIDGMGEALSSPSLKYIAQDGYIYVFQDIRWQFDYEWQFPMLQPLRNNKNPIAVNE